jgi:hypothetical protein
MKIKISIAREMDFCMKSDCMNKYMKFFAYL